MSNKKVGYLYKYFPVIVDLDERFDDDAECESIDTAWQWKYFGWVFNIIFYSREFVAYLFDLENPFVIAVPKEKKDVK